MERRQSLTISIEPPCWCGEPCCCGCWSSRWLKGENILLEHGGRLRHAARRFSIPVADWLDLSTGINPLGWPVPVIPASCWQRLPEADDRLTEVAKDYYGASSLLPVAGSQQAIQALPRLRSACRVGMLSPAYAEHAHAWRSCGHRVVPLRADRIDETLPCLDVLLLIHPNNPTGQCYEPGQLLEWHQQLAARGGWLLVDEAFMDCRPEQSLARQSGREGLIVLRSPGKFFGLAGARVGFVLGEQALLQRLEALLGPWTISHPSRWVAAAALSDVGWQQQTGIRLRRCGIRLRELLTACSLPPAGGCELFQWVVTADAGKIFEALARQGILIRQFEEPASLRFGLPGTEDDWFRLESALRGLQS
ncbi:MAG TPA: threonine-phosphate decarboxylase [Gammaproteobacteria bacterium]|nr:threonine-phosphate decarboxylase [Gammaproteobacteria bacterium]